MSKDTSLAYLGIEARSIAAWECFLRDGVGVATSRDAGTLVGRVDDRARRLIVREGARDDVAYVGWECESEADAARRAAPLASRAPLVRGTDRECAERAVEGFFRLRERNGLVFELCWGAERAAPAVTPLVPGGFVARELGLGHLAMLTDDHDASLAEYETLLGARLSDHIEDTELGILPMRIRFLHVNRRHHSIALVKAPLPFNPLPRSIHHFALQMASEHDVRAALARLEAMNVPIARTIGQHPNDRITSFYVRTPSFFDLEIGFGGITIDDDATWEPKEFRGISLWGHEVKSMPIAEAFRAGLGRAFGRRGR